MACDLTCADSPALVRDAVDDELHGRIDLLVNNAGGGERARFADGGWPNVERMMDLNFNAVMRLTEALLPSLRRSAPSVIVNVASLAGRIATPGRGAYSASKFALIGWSEALRAEERRAGVHVSTVLPGYIETEGIPQEALKARAATRWLLSGPDRVARAVAYAAHTHRRSSVVPRPWAALLAIHALLPSVTNTLTRRTR